MRFLSPMKLCTFRLSGCAGRIGRENATARDVFQPRDTLKAAD